ncbi:hypothetical protein M5K25_017975 [Dendrobium thyrsiflorum]|uniref:Uncharacterized protein n=1 Tax=Dendrobium thyrsiflorum TaxID=117978 RepID=A0ABD0UGW7_DENTH
MPSLVRHYYAKEGITTQPNPIKPIDCHRQTLYHRDAIIDTTGLPKYGHGSAQSIFDSAAVLEESALSSLNAHSGHMIPRNRNQVELEKSRDA